MLVDESFLPFVQKLYGNLKKNGLENLFVSPLSIYSTLALVLAGSETNCQKELLTVLELSKSSNFIKTVESAGDSLREIYKGDSQKTLSNANGIFIDIGLNIKESFQSLLDTHFDAHTQLVNFSSNPEDSRKTINNWISKETKDKIQELLKEGIIDSLTRLVLANAVYFKGTWANKFSKESTKAETFLGLEGNVYNVQMMTLKHKFWFTKLFDYNAIALRVPFQCHEMIIILPDLPTGLPTILETLTDSSKKDIFKAIFSKDEYENIEVILKMPKFKLGGSESIDLQQTLINMGVPSIFSQKDADFSGITGDKSLYVSAMVHLAVIEVDEEGAEAAAATAAVMNRRCAPLAPVPFTVDHPFAFFIVSESGFPLFMGHFVKPLPA